MGSTPCPQIGGLADIDGLIGAMFVTDPELYTIASAFS
jgi:hypothetical protein